MGLVLYGGMREDVAPASGNALGDIGMKIVALKGRKMIAQGNALGYQPQTSSALPQGATQKAVRALRERRHTAD